MKSEAQEGGKALSNEFGGGEAGRVAAPGRRGAQPSKHVYLPTPYRGRQREMSIEKALDWAFRVECARLDLDGQPDHYRDGVDGIWIMMQRGDIGCEVDGGGFSEAHDDAQIIASFVADLPLAVGGKGMAAQIASLARAGMRPDWMQDARPRCVPRKWVGPGHQYGKTEVFETITTRSRRGRKVKRDVLFCPVTYTPTAAQIGALRRGYLQWWGALMHLNGELRMYDALRSITLTDQMPPSQPWAAQQGLDQLGLGG